ncbi:hypothetical protein FRC02_010929 [Tulasnella sp. 418]|nr:hypothetical protein FRC02_010929 [Tulasnella sp. 418]
MVVSAEKFISFVINHIFMPPKLPQEDDLHEQKEHALSEMIHSCANEFGRHLPTKDHKLWKPIVKLLEKFSDTHRSSQLSEENVADSMADMRSGDTLAFLIRSQNAGIVIRKGVKAVIIESFEVSPQNKAVMGTKGKLLRSFPEPAVQIPTQVFEDPYFQEEFSSFLAQMDTDALDSTPTVTKAGSTVTEVRDTPHPRYITQLLTEILRGMGDEAEVPRITKRIADDVLWLDALKPWRRSPVFLVLRVALHTTLARQSGGHQIYKWLMLFIHARLLKFALQPDLNLPSHLIDCMRKKTARRFSKLHSDPPLPSVLLQYVNGAVNHAESLLQNRWAEAQNRQARYLSSKWSPGALKPSSDTVLTLLNSREYLKRSLQGVAIQKSSQPFDPKRSPRFRTMESFINSSSDQLEAAFNSDDRLITLADFERAVLKNSGALVTRNMDPSEKCSTIARLIKIYAGTASKEYESDPELCSMMILTLFKLWVELDKIAIAVCPLLREFSPEVPSSLLHPLLLHTSESIAALEYVEKYVTDRHAHAIAGCSVFTRRVAKTCFAVRYFDGDEEMLTRKEEIETVAAQKKARKAKELEEMKARHDDLKKSSEERNCDYVLKNTWGGRVRSVHSWHCKKCKLKEQANKMEIHVHEWPLPGDLVEAKMVVFELTPPRPFAIWRSITYMLLQEVCTPNARETLDEPPRVQLPDYPALKSYYTEKDGSHGSRIVLASVRKSFKKSHYRTKKVSEASIQNVCVNHGLRWSLFDSAAKQWATSEVGDCTIKKQCTFTLPSGPYENLQFAVSDTTHSLNEVIANQTRYSPNLSLHEYIAFASIRSGPRLQWLNIASELRSGSLNFGEEAVYALLRQAIWQMGPSIPEGGREWHIEPSQADFGMVLLAELNDLLLRLKANRHNIIGMQVITTLVSRLLVSTTDNEVTQGCFKLMQNVREATYEWLKETLVKLRDIEDENRLQECKMQVCEIAMTCRGTYDVDPDETPALLLDSEAVAIFIHCGIIIEHNSLPSFSQKDIRFRNLLHRNSRLAHIMEPGLWRRICQQCEGLDQAVACVLSFYRPSGSWERLPTPNERWILTCSASSQSQKSQNVQLDLLSGQLLIEGKPLGRLPRLMASHPTYHRIFGKRMLDVVPADMPGMDFKATNPVVSIQSDVPSHYEVFFGLRASNPRGITHQLVIRTRRDNEILELIPHETFVGDLPSMLVDDHTHWLNVSTFKGEIEVRGLKTRWESSPDNWRVYFSPSRLSGMCIKKGPDTMTSKLIDPRSKTMSMICAQLQTLEEAQWLLVTYSRTDTTEELVTSLPRFRLEFRLNQRNLECVSIPGMIIDANQSSGTLIGLRSQLILRAISNPMLRQIIIPYSSDCQFLSSTSEHHSSVTISIPRSSSPKYFKYTINQTLGQLEGDGTMLSGLYQVYLHAITSHCLTDPLTGYTGTEEALNQLKSARMLSFRELGENEQRMLQYISRLTPIRTFYPPHLEEMQTVKWSSQDIDPLSQHHDFYPLTNSIQRYAEGLTMFTPAQGVKGSIDLNSDHLLDRAALRNAMFYRGHITRSTAASGKHDVPYESRGTVVYTEPEDRGVVFNTSSLVHNWTSQLCTDAHLYDTLLQYGTISGSDEEISLAYDRTWLEQEAAEVFLSACNACRSASKQRNRYQMVFSFSSCAYRATDLRTLIPTICAFATVPELRAMQPPFVSSYDLSEGLEPNEDKLLDIIRRWSKGYEDNTESTREEIDQKASRYNERLSSDTKELLSMLLRQWPCETPVIPSTHEWLFHIPDLEREVKSVFQTWFENKELFQYIQDVQHVLDGVRSSIPARPTTFYTIPVNQTRLLSVSNYPSLESLLQERRVPHVPFPPTPLKGTLATTAKTVEHKTHTLQELLQDLRDGSFRRQNQQPLEIQSQYANDLDISLRSFNKEIKRGTYHQAVSTSQTEDLVGNYRVQCKDHLATTLQRIQGRLSPLTSVDKLLHSAGLWPCLKFRSLLGALGSTSDVLPGAWRKTLNCLARAILGFQHARRLGNYLKDDSMDEFVRELEETAIEEEVADDLQYSTRLIIQIDGDFLSRSIQLDFTREMTNPTSGMNSVFQLNMGEGKSSVIVPLATATLSDGKKLVRVVVLKPLAPAMFHLLVNRLSGLANRRIFYMPFSRSPQLTLDQVQQVQDLFQTCIREHGVLVVQPEHILSFKLMGLDRLLNTGSVASQSSPSADVVQRLLESQRWLDENSRDILDESDEILHVKYQLVYTVGKQQYLDGSPDRWTIIQQVLTLVKKHAPTVKQSHRDSFELLDDGSGSYPHIRVLQEESGAELIRLVAEDISRGALEQCSFDLFPTDMRSLALSYIISLNISSDERGQLESYCKKSEVWNTLLTLRGLLAYGTLKFVLKEKRWRVDYGPDPSRSLLAVPYRAKDVPSLRAEFSHPDVAILLTCLSYYWQGLSETQTEQCFNHLFKQDNPSLQYDSWVSQADKIPEDLRHFSSVDIHDIDQRAELHRLFHRNQAFIDFFLSNIVFPRDAKEFPSKMATSGWDLAERKSHVTTGFSGTKDGGYLLPKSIQQTDPLSQSSTNARVLTYLLQPENDHYQCIDQMTLPNAEQKFLHLLNDLKPKIRVLLDVGAQILKLSNEEAAAEWLESNTNPDVQAIVFFGTDDEIYVRTRGGMVEAFVSSPFRQQLDKCLVYLDDVHTRGIDFKLPSWARAAVTLGPKVTKDRLLQGCMRMRNLGRGHSVIFFAPLEVDLAIREAANLHPDDQVRVKDILLWTMFESCSEVVHRLPQWAQQGVDHRKREKAWSKFKNAKNTQLSSTSLESAWVRKEARSLEEMYAGGPSDLLSSLASQAGDDCADILSTYQKWASSSHVDTHFQEEQEREVIHEIEIERQVHRPARLEPAIPNVHDDIRTLVQTGVLKNSSQAFVPLFQELGGAFFEQKGWVSRDLLSTKDFASTTARNKRNSNTSDYLRPVHWILSTAPSTSSPIFIVLSPHEVNHLLPDIRRSKRVQLHLYAPRVMKSMKSLEDLAFYCIPPLSQAWVQPPTGVITRLNLWAGQLYLADEGMYQYLCNYLGLYSQERSEGDTIQPDGFIKPEHRRGQLLTTCPFTESPLPYLKKLFGARRKGKDFFSTHMGKILRARLLTTEDFLE